MLSMTRSHAASSARSSVAVIRPSTSSRSPAVERALGDLTFEAGGHRVDDGVGAVTAARTGDDVVPGRRDELHQAGAHHPRPDDADRVDLGHAASLVTRSVTCRVEPSVSATRSSGGYGAVDERVGVVAFCGGGAFERNDELDRRLLAEVGRRSRRHAADGRCLRAARRSSSPRRWRGPQRLGVDLEALMVMQRHDADDGAAADDRCRAGGLPRRRLLDAPAQRAQGHGRVRRAATRARTWRPRRRHRPIGGGAERPDVRRPRRRASRSASASRRAWRSSPRAEKWSEEALGRTRSLATTPVIALPTGSAAVSRGGRWELIGDAESSGDLRRRRDRAGSGSGQLVVAGPADVSGVDGAAAAGVLVAAGSVGRRPLPRASWWPECRRRHHRRRRRSRRARRRSAARRRSPRR